MANTVKKAAVLAIVEGLGTLPKRDYVPMAVWGSDHWKTFAYLETRTVDHKGTIAKQHMRTDAERHPGLAWRIFEDEDGNKKKYPTRLKHGIELEDHDDWDCSDDLCVAGLIEKLGTGFNPWVKMTDKGCLVAAALRQHKGAGGNFGNFTFGG